jgi:hypothetical protein
MESLFGNDRIDRIVEMLQQVHFVNNGRLVPWPADPVLDRQLVVNIMQRSPGLDLESLIPAFDGWNLDVDKQKKVVRARARFSKWCQIQDQRRGGHRAGPGGPGHGTQRSRGVRQGPGGPPLAADRWGDSGRTRF